MRHFINRLMAEEYSIDQSIKSLEGDINNEFFYLLSEAQRDLMQEQLIVMQQYHNIIKERIRLQRGCL